MSILSSLIFYFIFLFACFFLVPFVLSFCVKIILLHHHHQISAQIYFPSHWHLWSLLGRALFRRTPLHSSNIISALLSTSLLCLLKAPSIFFYSQFHTNTQITLTLFFCLLFLPWLEPSLQRQDLITTGITKHRK